MRIKALDKTPLTSTKITNISSQKHMLVYAHRDWLTENDSNDRQPTAFLRIPVGIRPYLGLRRIPHYLQT